VITWGCWFNGRLTQREGRGEVRCDCRGHRSPDPEPAGQRDDSRLRAKTGKSYRARRHVDRRIRRGDRCDHRPKRSTVWMRRSCVWRPRTLRFRMRRS
jgi:hypothetical protein